jgi:hypothetical protein
LQEELDHQLALKLQQELYDNPSAAPVPPMPPPLFASNNAPFRKRERDELRPPPTPEAIKRIMADYQEMLKSNNPLLYTTSD